MKENLNKKFIVVISSPSGAGKTSVCHNLIERNKNFGLSISDTTRQARDYEIDGVDYNFIDELEFKKKINNNSYLEYAEVFGNYYGSPHKNIIDHFENNKDIIFDIDWQGAAQLKKSTYSNIISIFIIPPSKDVIYHRLKLRAKRSGDNEKSIDERMKKYETEMAHKEEYDYIVINDELETCVKEIEEIIECNRTKLFNK